MIWLARKRRERTTCAFATTKSKRAGTVLTSSLMGSYLSIVNTTSTEWQCQLGPDEAALKIAGIIVSVLGAAAAVIGTLGAAAPIAAALAANGVVAVFGVSTSALAAVAGAAASISTATTVIGTISGFTMAVAKGVSENLVTRGYHTIAPGEKYRWGKMTLSLWQQGTCVRTVIVDEYTVRTETLYMRPIFSGSLADSNRDHDIQWWLNKWGVETKDVVAERPKAGTVHGAHTRALEDHATKVYKASETDVDELNLNVGDIVLINRH